MGGVLRVVGKPSIYDIHSRLANAGILVGCGKKAHFPGVSETNLQKKTADFAGNFLGKFR